VAKTGVNSGGATLLDEPRTDYFRPRDEQEAERRPPRNPRALPDGEDDAGEPFLRSRRRVPVRKGILPPWAKTRWGKVVLGSGALVVLGAGVATVVAARNFLDHDPRFRVASASAIQTVGNSQLTRDDLLSVFGRDIGHNLFFVPLAKRQAELEQFSWVERATVMRVLPNQLRVAVTERTPIAFVQVHGRIALADGAGVILDMTPQEMAAKHYSFPVVSGINPGDPLSMRAARMEVYQRFLSELDAGGEKISGQLSEIDLSDPEDVRAMVPSNGTDLQLQFGQEDFLARWRNYETHIAQWRQQYPKLAAVDLRYEHEVVLKMTPDVAAPTAAPAASATVAPKKAAPARQKAPDKTHTPGHAAAHAAGHAPAHAHPAAKHAGKGAR
jgi:cell division protein FtsQ